MRLFIAMILTLILVGANFPYIVNAASDEAQSEHQLVNLSREILALSKQHEYEHALNLLQHFSEEFIQSDKLKNDLSMQELKLVSNAYSDTIDALKSASLDETDRISRVISFHLLIDAVYSEYQPMWRKMENAILSPLEQMYNAVNRESPKDFDQSFDEFKKNYAQIKPALEVDLKEEEITRFDSYISYLDQFHDSLFTQKEETIQHVDLMKEDFTILFNQEKKDSADLSLPWLIFTIGGVIVSTLIYVGWMKYKAEREKMRKFKREP